MFKTRSNFNLAELGLKLFLNHCTLLVVRAEHYLKTITDQENEFSVPVTIFRIMPR